jgi:DNA-binding winged helix-turn-helix (wHTH) protein
LPLCDRCGEEIALANDLDQAGDIDRRRHFVLVAGKPRRLTPNFWRLFTLLYRHRGDVVDNDRIWAELYDEADQPLAANAVRENVRRLRRALAGSRYEIINHPTLGYELIVSDVPARRRQRARKLANAIEALSSVDATPPTRS